MERLRIRGIHPMQWNEYELAESAVKVRERSLRGMREFSVDYDCIGKEDAYFLKHSVSAKFWTIFFVALSAITGLIYLLHGNAERLAWLFWMGAAFLAFITYKAGRREGFHLASSYGDLVIHGKRKDVGALIKAIQKRKLEFIYEKMLRRISVMDQSEGKKYLLALKEGSVLAQEQYDAMNIMAGLESGRNGYQKTGVIM